ncbi:hypothetical protein ACFFQW_32605 [Umezawaea endophytica]|uniref:Uncharacterized protein n=1 Tax=Umezawaea endophytica TaxID=1654476 RepID=A0A9X2VVZ6_9PSEU|nr:hypothetical protein [Umezawaea endophytica]MCS7483873.1 hypothetical protein [Umezawaea endophytica]
MDHHEYEVDGRTHNEHSGATHHSLQARDVQGGINVHTTAPEPLLPPLPWSYTAAAYGALFAVTSAYSHTIANLNLTVWDWLKLTLSAALLIPVFITTEYRLQGTEFAPLRLLSAIVVVALAINQGPTLLPGLVPLLSNWIIWHF